MCVHNWVNNGREFNQTGIMDIQNSNLKENKYPKMLNLVTKMKRSLRYIYNTIFISVK